MRSQELLVLVKNAPVSHQSFMLQHLFVYESTKRLPRDDGYLVPSCYLLCGAKFTCVSSFLAVKLQYYLKL